MKALAVFSGRWAKAVRANTPENMIMPPNSRAQASPPATTSRVVMGSPEASAPKVSGMNRLRFLPLSFRQPRWVDHLRFRRRNASMRSGTAFLLAALAVIALPTVSTPARADIEIDLQSRNPMLPAVRQGNVAQVRRLLLTGRSPDVADAQHRTAVVLAAAAGNVGVAELLIEYGADVKAEDVRGYTALHEAAAADEIELVEMLIDAGAPLDAADRYGATPLMLAAASERGRTVSLLLEAGADRHLQDYTGRTALDWARDRGNRRAERLLSEDGGGD